MKLIKMSDDWNVLVLSHVTDDDAQILEILGCEHIDSIEVNSIGEELEIWKRN